MKESPIFIKSYEMMVWLMGRTGKFPKNQRFLMAKRMEETALDFFRLLNEAARSRGEGKQHALARADLLMADLKFYNRLCKDLKLLAFNQYEHLAGLLDELGKLLGGWKKGLEKGSGSA